MVLQNRRSPQRGAKGTNALRLERDAEILLLGAFCALSWPSFRQLQSVADAMHGLDPARLLRVRLQLGAQAGNVIVHRARRRKRGVAPDHVEKPLAGD